MAGQSKQALLRTMGVGGVGVAALALAIRSWGERSAGKTAREIARSSGAKPGKDGKKKRGKKVAVDAVFVARMKRLLRVLVPGLLSREAGYAGLVAVMLVARTVADIKMLQLSTAIEARIIARDAQGFVRGITAFAKLMVPVALVNALLKYAKTELAIGFRENLTNHLTDKLLTGFTFYSATSLDSRLANPDQLVCQDVDRFAQSCSDLYTNVSKPLMDVVIYSRKLSSSIGAAGPASMLGYLVLSGSALTWLRRPTGRFTINEQTLEGAFRHVMGRLVTHAEEIAFYNGAPREREAVRGRFNQLVGLLRQSQQFRFSMGVVDSIIAKYAATILGFSMVARPFLDPSTPALLNASQNQLVEYYYTSGRMMINLASAMGRLVLAGRELTRLAGFTARVTELVDVIDDVSRGEYQRTMVSADDPGSALAQGLAPNAGRLVAQDDVLRFDGVPLVTPNGDVLVRSLDVEIPRGTPTIVVGPNGCGKSSFFRHLGELWPLWGGTLTKPASRPGYSALFYVPQRPYLPLGTLRDQIIYPQSFEDFVASGATDDDLRQHLRNVKLEYLVEREAEGMDTIAEWADVLSGGEKQRIAMARLFHARPAFAVLDECTSAVSVDVESFMYEHCAEVGITLLTVSHRRSLWAHHRKVLRFDGRGGYSVEDITEETEQFGS